MRKSVKLLIGGVVPAVLIVAAVPFVLSLTPTKDPWDSGELVRVDISTLEPGQHLVATWKKNIPIYIVHRTQEMIDSVDSSKKPTRFGEKDYLVVDGRSTWLGCFLTIVDPWPDPKRGRDGDQPLFFSPCHGEVFDADGANPEGRYEPLKVPPYHLSGKNEIIIGSDVTLGG